MSAAPTLFGDSVYFCDNDGRCASATKRKRKRNWEFYTDGAISISPVVTDKYVFVASSDRSLYCLDRETGRRNWTHRFDNVPDLEPVISDDLIFQRTKGNNVHDADAADHQADEGEKEDQQRHLIADGAGLLFFFFERGDFEIVGVGFEKLVSLTQQGSDLFDCVFDLVVARRRTKNRVGFAYVHQVAQHEGGVRR